MGRWSLIVRSGEASGRRIVVDGELLLGRAAPGDGSLLGDPKLSREHARLRRTSAGLMIEDLGSANGTHVNGAALPPRAAHVLKPGDTIRAGGSIMEVESDAGAAQPAAADLPPTDALMPSLKREPAGTPSEQVGSPSAIGLVPPVAPAAGAQGELLRAGQRIQIPPAGIAIGRAGENDVVIDNPEVSRQHARVATAEGRFYVADLGSGNGTLMNGERLRDESRWLNSGDTIEVGDETLRFVAGQQTQFGQISPVAERDVRSVELRGATLSVGRDSSNDLTLDDPNVSRFHAEIRRDGDRVELRDLGSRNGTRLNREFIKGRANLVPGSEIGIGPFRLVYDGTKFIRRDDRGALRLRAEEITMAIKDKVILNRASIQIEPGEFVVVIGESGSGKTTMVKALAGVTTPTAGQVLVSGEPVMSRLTDIGYVPQDEIVHRGLTVLEGLRFAAALRLPGDSSPADIEESVQRVLAELSLEEHANTRIGSLSGGQRKRVGVGTELLNRPSLLFLDEPTTGLDPGLETRLMELFSALSQEGSRAVTAVTHATKNLDLPDKVCVMGVGGELAFFGPPGEAKDFFGAKSYDGIYTALDSRPATEWRQEFEAEEARRAAKADQDAARQQPARAVRVSRPQPSAVRQGSLLSRRYLKLFLRDQKNLLLLLGQAPLIALGIALLFQGDVLKFSGLDPNNGALLLFLLVTTMIWMGSIDAAREIIKERTLMERERAVGVRLSAYLFSKAAVLFTLVAVQAVLLAAVVFAFRRLEEPLQVYGSILFVLMVTGAVAVGMGLLISAVVSSEDQAASFIPLALIPQLLFGGAIVTVHEMGDGIAAFSNAIFSRWAFADVGAAADMNERLAGDSPAAASAAQRYGDDFFSISGPVGLAILVGFAAFFFAATYLVLKLQRSRN